MSDGALEQARKDIGWFKQHAVALVAFGFSALATLVAGVTAWNAVTTDVANTTKRVDGVEETVAEFIAEERTTTDGLEDDIRRLSSKIDGVRTDVEVITNEIANQKDGQEQIQTDVREIRNLLQRYLLPPSGPNLGR